jgi:N-sulfoglucosamine sulfohydrolase
MASLRSLFTAVLLMAFGVAAMAAPKPNIVVFLGDDHSVLDSEPYGATDVRTPNLRRLANEALLFTHAFVASPSSCPRATARRRITRSRARRSGSCPRI